MKPVVFALPACHALAADLAPRLDAEVGALTLRHFPDDETYVRLDTDVAGRAAIIACTLDRPDDKLVPILYAAATAKELGAVSVGLVAPYLAYLRQDRRFQSGEGVTSRYFARVLSAARRCTGAACHGVFPIWISKPKPMMVGMKTGRSITWKSRPITTRLKRSSA